MHITANNGKNAKMQQNTKYIGHCDYFNTKLSSNFSFRSSAIDSFSSYCNGKYDFINITLKNVLIYRILILWYPTLVILKLTFVLHTLNSFHIPNHELVVIGYHNDVQHA